jgi:heptosyltransferase-2
MQYLVYLLCRVVLGLFGLLPIRLVYGIGWLFGRLGYFLAGPYRRLALHNLKIAFPEESEAARRAIAREHFARLLANVLSGVRIGTVPSDELSKIAPMYNREVFDRLVAKNRGMVLALAHLSNWELVSRLGAGFFPPGRNATIYQPIGNPFIDGYFRALRSRFGLVLFNRRDGFTAPISFIRAGGAIGILVDQHAGDIGAWVPFFGRLASTTTLAALMAGRTHAAIVPCAVYTTGAARWRLQVSEPVEAKPGESVESWTARVNTALESMIRESPADWFWVHNRWKTPKPKFLLADYKRGVTLPAGMAPGELQRFKILVRSPNWLGDAVMAIPAVRALAAGRPDAEITVLTPAKIAELWKSVPEVKGVLEIAPDRAGAFAVASRIRAAGPFDVAILLPNSLRSALEVWLAGVPRRVGYAGHTRSALLNQLIREPVIEPGPTRPHHSERYLHLARSVGAPESAPRTSVRKERSGGFVRIGLVPGAEYGPTKRWFPERFAEAAKKIAMARPCRFVLFGVAKDAEIGRAIEAELGAEHCENRIGKTSLAELMQELRQCDLVLTNDTGTMHLAAWLDVPLVAVFGSTDPVATGPLSSRARVIRHQVECSPCFLRECPLDLRCLKAVSADEVAAAALEMLAPA